MSVEDAEFAYEPKLDESRDGDLIDILPDYLVEEICFPRSHAEKFWSKLHESMMRSVARDDS